METLKSGVLVVESLRSPFWAFIGCKNQKSKKKKEKERNKEKVMI